MTVPRAASECEGQLVMIDVETLDRMFDVSRETGVPIGFHIFDRRVLLSLEQLLADVNGDDDPPPLRIEDLMRYADAGWYPLLETGHGLYKHGAPAYATQRIRLLVELQRQGFSEQELSAVAEYEEAMIDGLLTCGEFEYLDDDLDCLIAHVKARIEDCEAGTLYRSGERVDLSDEVAKHRKHLAVFERLKRDGIPTNIEPKIARSAFRLRAMNDATRMFLLDEDHAKLRAGYSMHVTFRGYSCKPFGEYAFGAIMWDETIRSALAHDDSTSGPTIRVPGFVLKGELIVPSKTLRPAEYERSWKSLDLDGYLLALANIRGERRCLNCLVPIDADAPERKRFCSEQCRNASKQRRHREHNPRAVEEAQRRYYASLDDE
jgi:hypothetical protein